MLRSLTSQQFTHTVPTYREGGRREGGGREGEEGGRKEGGGRGQRERRRKEGKEERTEGGREGGRRGRILRTSCNILKSQALKRFTSFALICICDPAQPAELPWQLS